MLAVGLNAALGNFGLLVLLGAGVVGALSTAMAVITGNRRGVAQAPVYAALIVLGALIATFAMQRALAQRDYSLAFIQRVGSWTTPGFFNIAAMWSALEGSILLWLLVLAGFTAAVAFQHRRRVSDPLVAWALVVLFVIVTFFGILTFGPANPFQSGAPVPVGFDGPGPNPLLQNHILVLFHPPLLYIGYVGISVPFAFAIAALITGRVGEGWLLETRRWALISWGFLTLGILLGGWWSYEVLGWSGVWVWDPVENASFLPWLTATAYLHSVLVQQRRGMLRVWNLSLLVATFSLTILGTFLTRSGVINSVHAFASGGVGGYLLGFFALVVIVSLGLIAWRGDRLRSPGVIDSPVSREGAFLANNVAFAVFAFVVLLGTVFPLIIEATQGRRTAVGAPYFDRLSMPIGMALLFLMAVAPVLPWRKASTELIRDRLFWPAWGGVGAVAIAVIVGADRWAPLVGFGLAGFAAGAALRQITLSVRRQGWRGLLGRSNGGMIVHLGLILVAIALVASNAYTSSSRFTVTQGEVVEWNGHTFELTEVTVETTPRAEVAMAHVRLDGGQEYGPAMTTYLRMGQTVPTPSVRTSLTEDIYLTIDGNNPPPAGSTEVVLMVYRKPMIIWMWIGGLLMALGTVLAAFPARRRRPVTPVVDAISETADV